MPQEALAAVEETEPKKISVGEKEERAPKKRQTHVAQLLASYGGRVFASVANRLAPLQTQLGAEQADGLLGGVGVVLLRPLGQGHEAVVIERIPKTPHDAVLDIYVLVHPLVLPPGVPPAEEAQED